MSEQAKRAEEFAALHVPGAPLVLYNIWDAGSAGAVAKAGAAALATGSWSVAAAQGYADGESIPLPFLLQIVERIVTSVELPLTVDFEGGYAVAPEALAENVSRLIAAGAIGINFEDQIVGGEGLHTMDVQAARIVAARAAAMAAGVPLFINARTDLFLKEKDAGRHGALVEEAVDRGLRYAEAGASGFFVPGLVTPDLIRAVCEGVGVPVNVMMKDGMGSSADLAGLGVARISYGPAPYFTAMKDLKARVPVT